MENDNIETISAEENDRLIQEDISYDGQQSKRVHEGRSRGELSSMI